METVGLEHPQEVYRLALFTRPSAHTDSDIMYSIMFVNDLPDKSKFKYEFATIYKNIWFYSFGDENDYKQLEKDIKNSSVVLIGNFHRPDKEGMSPFDFDEDEDDSE